MTTFPSQRWPPPLQPLPPCPPAPLPPAPLPPCEALPEKFMGDTLGREIFDLLGVCDGPLCASSVANYAYVCGLSGESGGKEAFQFAFCEIEGLARLRACTCFLTCFWRASMVASIFWLVKTWLSKAICFLFGSGVFFHLLALRRLRMSVMDFLFRRRATWPFFSQSSFSTLVMTVDSTRRR